MSGAVRSGPGADARAEGLAAPQVLMYSKSWCPYCERARALLHAKHVRFEEIDIERQPERREEMIRRSGRRTVPQVFVGERHLGGSDDLYGLEAAGQLDALLHGA